MIDRRSVLAGATAAVATMALPAGSVAEAASGVSGLLTWQNFLTAAELVSDVASAVSTCFEINKALAAPIGNAPERATKLVAAQPAILDELGNFKMIVEQALDQRDLRAAIRDLRVEVNNAHDVIINMEGHAKSTEALHSYMALNKLLDALRDWSSAAIFPAYSAGVSMQLLLAQIAISSGDTGLSQESVRTAAKKHQSEMASWADKSRPTNPKALVDTLQPEISKLVAWTKAKPLPIRIAETITKYEHRYTIPGSSPPKTETSRTWFVKEVTLIFNGFTDAGEILISQENKTVQSYVNSSDVPYRYFFISASSAQYYNATDSRSSYLFPCLVTNDDYETWEGAPDSNGDVWIPNHLLNIYKEKENCVRSIYSQIWENLKALTLQEQQYISAAGAIGYAASNLENIVV